MSNTPCTRKASVSNETAPAPEGSSTSNFALLIFRLACALPVLYHGSGILFGAFGGPGPRGFAAYLHLPMMDGYLVGLAQDRKSTRLNSSHRCNSYAVFCLKKIKS